jgi:uncharacterized protein (DUF849 family)
MHARSIALLVLAGVDDRCGLEDATVRTSGTLAQAALLAGVRDAGWRFATSPSGERPPR